jgi:hypothetical protein
MKPHALPFRGREPARLVPDPVLDAHTPDVVQEPGTPQPAACVITEPGVPCGLRGQRGDRAGVSTNPGRLEVGEVGERREHRVEPVATDGGDRLRLAREDSLPFVRTAQPEEDVGPHLPEGIDDGGVVRAAASPAQPFPRVVADHGRKIGVPRHDDYTHREGNRISFEPSGETFPVPPLVGVGESVDHRSVEAGASGEHRADLAVRGHRALGALWIGEAPCNEPNSPRQGLTRGDAAHEPAHQLPTRAHEDWSHRRVEREVVAASQRGGLGRIGRAPEEAEERELVDGADLLRRASHRLRDGDGDRAGA